MINETISAGLNVATSYIPYVPEKINCDYFCQFDKIHPTLTLVATFLAIGAYVLMGYDYFTRGKQKNVRSEQNEI